MATVGTLFPSSTSAGATSSTSQQLASITSNSSTDKLANQETFLQLLVAQLKNQDPSQPVEGTTFVTQLAQFSDLQANLGSKQDLDAISKQYVGTTPSATTSTKSGG